MSTFTNFKTQFYSRINNFELFDCGDVNLLKVVLDGLKVNYISKGNVRAYIFYPLFIYNFISFIKRVFFLKKNTQFNKDNFFKSKENTQFLVSDIGRIIYDSDKNPKSVYFDNIIKHLGRHDCIIVLDQLIDKGLDYDICVSKIYDQLIYKPLSKDEKIFRKNLLNTFTNIKKQNIFTSKELKNIQFAFHLFFNQFKIWNTLLNCFPKLKKAYFVCHYHKEGQIYALRKKNVECIELQHGLIAPQDIFYIFPQQILSIKHKALFPDKILVYGKYWKTILLKGCEFSENQIKILGYYLYDNFSNFEIEKKQLDSIINNKKVILVTTQTFLHDYFIKFIKELEYKINTLHAEYIILVKPHPSENIILYTSEFKNSECVNISTLPVNLLFQKTNIHISIYSTTLYDAVRFGIQNYVFKIPDYQDYTDEIIKSGIANEITSIQELLSNNELPIKYCNNFNYYSKLDYTVL